MPPRRRKPANQLWNSQQVADYLNISVDTLYAWRSQMKAPPGFQVGRFTRYRPADVEKWIDEMIAKDEKRKPPRSG